MAALKVSVAVMAHPRRAALVHELTDSLDRPIEVVWDQRDSAWDTARRAWEAYDPSATHHLVLEDDAIACRDLVAGLELALTHVPAQAPVSLYVGTLRPDGRRVAAATARANTAGSAWIVMPDIKWGVAIAAPTPVIPEMLAHADGHVYDWNLRSYFAAQRWPVWCTWPSLVDHRDAPGIVRHQVPPSGPRHAHRFLSGSALDVDWGAGVTWMPGAERLRPQLVRPTPA
jgi:hypothetical protein